MEQRNVMDKIIAAATFRKNVYRMVPDGSTRILDFGCGSGSLALRLARDKGCREVYGLETDERLTQEMQGLVDGVFHVNLEHEGHELPEEFKGFFDWIILHDVVEHFYDPWYTLPKIARYLSPQGRMIIATPNVQYWELQHKIMTGHFPYGPGLWHTGHLRWYTLTSLLELVVLSGLGAQGIFLEIPAPVDPRLLQRDRPVNVVQFPPVEVAHETPDVEPLIIRYPRDIRRGYPLFLAHKLIVVCSRIPGVEVEPVPHTYNCPYLAARREALKNPYDIYNPPPFQMLIGDWC